jgi:hypothetical protein
MAGHYANITLQGPRQDEVVLYLNETGYVAYVTPASKGCTVVYHQDLSTQETLAEGLAAHFRCPALLVMDYGGKVLLYQLYVRGHRVDSYVSTPHDGLELDGAAPEGNPEALAEAFGRQHLVRQVEKVLRKPSDDKRGYALAVNRHGELANALGLPLFAAGASFTLIEIGEMPGGPDFDPTRLVRTGARAE